MYVRVLGEHAFLSCVTVRDRGRGNCQDFERRYRSIPGPCSKRILSMFHRGVVLRSYSTYGAFLTLRCQSGSRCSGCVCDISLPYPR